MIRWGLVSTIKAPPTDVLDYVAYHIDMGAHRLYIYLDEPNAVLADQLAAHPKVRVVETDDAWWEKRNGRPKMHQQRQERNAQHAYRRRAEVDWLIHMDVDEFLCPARPIDEILGKVWRRYTTARVMPVEKLIGAPNAFKSYHHNHRRRQRVAERLYPNYGRYLPGGFVSHIVGKAFVRTGLDNIKMRIHGISVDDVRNPNDTRLGHIELAHVHAASWEHWLEHFYYRHKRGSYRKGLPGVADRMNRHALLGNLLEEHGEAGLRHFFDEVLLATPEHLDALRKEGLLRQYDLQLEARRKKHFPDI